MHATLELEPLLLLCKRLQLRCVGATLLFDGPLPLGRHPGNLLLAGDALLLLTRKEGGISGRRRRGRLAEPSTHLTGWPLRSRGHLIELARRHAVKAILVAEVGVLGGYEDAGAEQHTHNLAAKEVVGVGERHHLFERADAVKETHQRVGFGRELAELGHEGGVINGVGARKIAHLCGRCAPSRGIVHRVVEELVHRVVDGTAATRRGGGAEPVAAALPGHHAAEDAETLRAVARGVDEFALLKVERARERAMLKTEDGGLPVAGDGLEELDERCAVDIAGQFRSRGRDAERSCPCEDAGDAGDEVPNLKRTGHHIGCAGGLRCGRQAGIAAVGDDDDGQAPALRLDLGKEGERRTIREPRLGQDERRRGRTKGDAGLGQARNAAHRVASLSEAQFGKPAGTLIRINQ